MRKFQLEQESMASAISRHTFVNAVREAFIDLAVFAFIGSTFMHQALQWGLPASWGHFWTHIAGFCFVLPLTLFLFEFIEKGKGSWHSLKVNATRYDELVQAFGCAGAFMLGALMELKEPVNLLPLYVIFLLVSSTLSLQARRPAT